jgi:acyl-CoA synthetase (NDP forming)
LAETGELGRRTEQSIADVARRGGMRVVGPNCFGVVSRIRGVHLDATFGTQHPRTGTLAIGSQSGGAGIALLDQANRRDLGLASFVSLGNKLDVSGNDLLAAWEDDPAVDVAALYLESFGNPAKFVRLAASFGRSKPLLAVFGGTSTAGRRGGASHTAASATPKRALDAVFRASGVVQVDGITDLVDTAALLSEQPLPAGGRIGIVSNAGGLGVMAADAALVDLLTVPAFGEDLQRRVVAVCTGVAGSSNPVDLGAGASAVGFGMAVSELLDSDEVDALLVVVAATAVAGVSEAVAAVDDAVGQNHVKPCALVVIGEERGPVRGPATRFDSTEPAVRSLRHAVVYANWRRAADDTADPPRNAATKGEMAAPATKPLVDPWTPPPSTGWMTDEECAGLLSTYQVPVVARETIHDATEVGATLQRLGLPVVVKTAVAGVVHKIERALVRTNLRDSAAVANATRSVQADCPGPVLVQQHVTGPELAIGIVRDDGFGPLVMVASGGTNLSLWDDQIFLLPPITPAAAMSALRSLKTWPLLTGYRGSEPRDTARVAELVCQVGRLAVDWPQLQELDLNPVIVTGDGPVCVDVKLNWSGPDVRDDEERVDDAERRRSTGTDNGRGDSQ